MTKRTILAVAVALAALTCPAAVTQAKEPPALVTSDRGLTESVLTMRVRGDLTFGPDGVVKEHHITTKLDPKVAEYIDKTIGKLKFKPYLQDGVPVNAKTYFQITLAAHPKDGGYAISVDNSQFNDTEYLPSKELRKQVKSSRKCVVDCIVYAPDPPVYPMGLWAAGVSGGVMVHLYLNPDGTVADAVVAQSALYNIRGNDGLLDYARKLMEDQSLEYARHIRAAPGSGSPLVGDDHLVATLPFDFNPNGRSKTDNEGKWRLEQRGKRNVASWLANDPDRWVGVSDTSGGGFMAMKDSPYKLVPNDAHTP
ncbi:hypothetical protein [Solilutibacter silvestris]|uniref:Gram-negative bacterial tonB protein n=1 Tax=Solilutibacter silvestris TaxID=1645665 RepID=A0A2K1Q0J0_9GAMM|nr:hypothetical protein [Lysobacter silvestris]PNS08562.1 hypothetical protein Lysil_0191 [Lysobacter silvestris]